MQRHLKLVESDFENLEKRVLPSFPFCYMVFKSNKSEQHFEIKDISKTGMQLVLRNGDINYSQDENIGGTIHWNGSEVDIVGQIKWVSGRRMGVEFSGQASQKDAIGDFLSVDNFVSHLKPVHKIENVGFEVPNLLRYWFRADGPVELFVWEHTNKEIARFQVIFMENFLEYEDGKGLRSGRVMSKRDIDTPLIHEDEFVFKIDQRVGQEKIDLALNLIAKIPESLIEDETKEFLCRKLGQ